MRVLQFVHYYPPESRGGTQEYVRHLSGRLVARGHDVHVVCGSTNFSRPHEVERETADDGITTTRLFRRAPDEAFSGDLGSARLAALIDAEVHRFDPDVVHVHHWSALTNDLVQRFVAHGRRVVVTLHDLFVTCPRFFRMPDSRTFCESSVTFRDCAACVAPDLGGRSVDEIEPMIHSRFAGFQRELADADVVLCVSQAQRDLLNSLPGFDDPGIVIEPIGLAADLQPPSTKLADASSPNSHPPRLRIANWGGLDPRKGVHKLIEAVAQTSSPRDFEVHFHGGGADPDFVEELHRLAAGLRVQFHGRYADAELLDFGRYDLAVFPFLAFETYGLVVDEALLLGLPVIATDHGAPPERLGARGLTVPRDDARVLATTLDEIRTHPDRLRRMREGRHHARRLDDHVERLLRHYRG